MDMLMKMGVLLRLTNRFTSDSSHGGCIWG